VWRVDDHLEIELTQGKVSKVDDSEEVRSILKAHNFCCRYTPLPRASTRIDKHCVVFSHLLMGKPPSGMVIDHVNRDSLDDRRANLRFATFRINDINHKTKRDNTTGVTGLRRRERRQTWVIKWSEVNGKKQERYFPDHRYGDSEVSKAAAIAQLAAEKRRSGLYPEELIQSH